MNINDFFCRYRNCVIRDPAFAITFINTSTICTDSSNYNCIFCIISIGIVHDTISTINRKDSIVMWTFLSIFHVGYLSQFIFFPLFHK